MEEAIKALKERSKDIIEHYGLPHQKRKLAEEMFELIEAITQNQCNPCKKTHDHVIEEIADNLVLLMQMALYYHAKDSEILMIMAQKIARTKIRMSNDGNQ